jgi:hypothetical protein
MIDPARLGSDGRTVRCAGCRATWFVVPEAETAADIADGAAAEMPPDDEAAAAETEAEAPQQAEDAPVSAAAPDARSKGDDAERFLKSLRKGRGERASGGGMATRARGLAGPLLIAVALLAGAAAVLARVHIVQTFPGAAALYARIGLPVNLRGFEFRSVKSELVAAGTEAVLVVEGEIANVSGRSASVPPIEIRVRGGEGQVLYTWTIDPPRSVMDGGETAHFRARLASPPPEGRQVFVHFAPGQDGAALASRGR